jgi:hypothetical protein
MEMQPVRASDVLAIAQSFRQRAAEAIDTSYYRLMLRTAVELEELAHSLTHRGELALSDDQDAG